MNQLALQERIQERVAMLPDSPGCWLWLRATNAKGYGMTLVDGRQFYAHRVAYEAWRGPIPNGKCLLHRCDTPTCVNPFHMTIGSRRENVADRVAKRRSRGPRGSAHGRSKLTEDGVRYIRLNPRGLDICTLALAFGVSEPTVVRARDRKTWSHI